VEAKVAGHPDKIIYRCVFSKAPASWQVKILHLRRRIPKSLNISPVIATAALARLKLLAPLALLVKREPNKVGDEPNGKHGQTVHDCIG
jgi:hypothetical protein